MPRPVPRQKQSMRRVTILFFDAGGGHRNASEAEIIKGLTEGAEVILHPANDLKDDARVIPRN